MINDPLSAELKNFIACYIHSVGHLEILCLLAKNPNRIWSEREVFSVILSSQESVAACLRYLASVGLLSSCGEGTYRFLPDKAALIRGTSELAKAYVERRVTIVEAIYRLRTRPIIHFADAFRIRKDKE